MNFKEQYFNIWQQIWNLHKKYYNIRADDEKAWERLDQECKQLDQQVYNGLHRLRFTEQNEHHFSEWCGIDRAGISRFL